ncbi:Hypothetical protein AKI40_2840 [Enterobacter sp. FY-07]|nr:Hypothetical protein AKI40_2840 [Enterobacter sp. FY-07]
MIVELLTRGEDDKISFCCVIAGNKCGRGIQQDNMGLVDEQGFLE